MYEGSEAIVAADSKDVHVDCRLYHGSGLFVGGIAVAAAGGWGFVL